MLFLGGLDALAAGGSFAEIGDALRPTLAQGEVPCLATATPAAYRAHVVPDAALADCFRIVPVAAPTKEEAIEMMHALRDRYEAFHRVQITDEALAAAVELAEQHLRGRLPRTALDALDEACARVGIRSQTPPPDFRDLDVQIERLVQEKEAAVADLDFDRAARLRDQIDQLKGQKDARTIQWRERSRAAETILDVTTVADVVAELKRAEEVVRPAG